ncbi:MAG: hypothetical protein AMXMBFR77_01760 [Phycisphaerales bacterium]|nr:hypothetical protein [Phycisphaerales bacterium]GIK18585.1 MAG: hypothetical protein BroJett004_07490 [Planctomycetota bacterium]
MNERNTNGSEGWSRRWPWGWIAASAVAGAIAIAPIVWTVATWAA